MNILCMWSQLETFFMRQPRPLLLIFVYFKQHCHGKNFEFKLRSSKYEASKLTTRPPPRLDTFISLVHSLMTRTEGKLTRNIYKFTLHVIKVYLEERHRGFKYLSKNKNNSEKCLELERRGRN